MSIERQNIADTLGGYQLKSHDEMTQRRSEAKSAMQEYDENVEGVPGSATWKPQQPTDQQRSEHCPKCGGDWTGNIRETSGVFCQKCGHVWTPGQQRSDAVTESRMFSYEEINAMIKEVQTLRPEKAEAAIHAAIAERDATIAELLDDVQGLQVFLERTLDERDAMTDPKTLDDPGSLFGVPNDQQRSETPDKRN